MLVHEGAGSLMVWETVARNYFFIFFSALKVWVFFLQSLISQTVLCVPLTVKWNRKRMLSLSSRNECYRYPQVTELCSFEMVYDITLIYQQTVCSFTADFGSGFRLKLQSAAMMVSSRKGLLEDEIEQSLLEELTASDQSSCSDDDD